MENLKEHTFTANCWNTRKPCEGTLTFRDRQTIEVPEKGRNYNGYIICIETEKGLVIVDPDTIKLKK